MPRLVWIVPVALAVLLPLSAFLSGFSATPELAIPENALFVLAITVLALLGFWVGTTDAWLGAGVTYVAVRAAFTPTPFAYETAQYVAFGAVLLVSARRVPDVRRPLAARVLTGAAVVQVAFAFLQSALLRDRWVDGMLGNPNHLGAFVAIAMPLAPWWVLPGLAVGLVLSQSALAGLAAACGLCLRYRSQWRWAVPLSLALLAAVLASRGLRTESWQDRLLIWRMAGQVATQAPWVGWGPGAWQTIGPIIQRSPEIASRLHTPPSVIWYEVHNEPIQLGFETGILGVGLLTGWLWHHRRGLFTGSWGAAAAAVGVVSLASFPFHVPTLAVLSVTVLGIATAPERSRDHGEG